MNSPTSSGNTKRPIPTAQPNIIEQPALTLFHSRVQTVVLEKNSVTLLLGRLDDEMVNGVRTLHGVQYVPLRIGRYRQKSRHVSVRGPVRHAIVRASTVKFATMSCNIRSFSAGSVLSLLNNTARDVPRFFREWYLNSPPEYAYITTCSPDTIARSWCVTASSGRFTSEVIVRFFEFRTHDTTLHDASVWQESSTR